MFDFDEVNKLIATKVMGLVEGEDFGNLGKHNWERNEYGLVNTNAFTIGECEGPVCIECMAYYCEVHKDCETEVDYREECTIPVPDYRRVLYFKRLFHLIRERYIIQLTVMEEVRCFLTAKGEYRKDNHLDYGYGGAETINEAVCLALYEILKKEEGHE